MNQLKYGVGDRLRGLLWRIVADLWEDAALHRAREEGDLSLRCFRGLHPVSLALQDNGRDGDLGLGCELLLDRFDCRIARGVAVTMAV